MPLSPTGRNARWLCGRGLISITQNGQKNDSTCAGNAAAAETAVSAAQITFAGYHVAFLIIGVLFAVQTLMVVFLVKDKKAK